MVFKLKVEGYIELGEEQSISNPSAILSLKFDSYISASQIDKLEQYKIRLPLSVSNYVILREKIKRCEGKMKIEGQLEGIV